ncbi:MAG TPA: hypothetical protein VN802_06650 [Stellaceae bacterium]|nr:hypothetical protein [Stellaceae bacterium]
MKTLTLAATAMLLVAAIFVFGGGKAGQKAPADPHTIVVLQGVRG